MTGATSLLVCPDPDRCPVAATDQLEGTRLVRVDPSPGWWRCYDGTWGYDEFNPGTGAGQSRFAPFTGPDGVPVPTVYAAADPQAALLETVFHDVHHSADRLVYEADLRRMLLCHAELPAPATLVDLRDDALAVLGLDREQVVTSPAEHYPCTRSLAAHLHRRVPDAQGIVWHSRQAELGGHGQVEVLVLFGDRYSHQRGSWNRQGAGSQTLFTGGGRLLVDEVATALGAIVIPAE